MADQEESTPIDVDQEEFEPSDSEQEGSEQIGVGKDGFVTIAGNPTKLPKIALNEAQPAKDKDLTAWFLANAKVHKGSSKIFDVKTMPVYLSIVYGDIL